MTSEPFEPLHPARWWHRLADGRVKCDLCPRGCVLHEGQRAFCFVRENVGGEMRLSSYGRSTGFAVDPIEKKPLFHFYPGSPVLSFGTAGCNLGCKFCQNWDISKSRETERLSSRATPEEIAAAAVRLGCRSVAFTYNDPVIFAEYAMDAADACHAVGIKTVAVTAGYIEPGPRAEFFAKMDAANVDLKSFRERFYHELSAAHLAPVLDTIRWLVRETRCWTELTTLLIPGHNDGDEELHDLVDWVLAELGPDVPLHFTAFHPDYLMLDVPPTPIATLRRARNLAKHAGLHHVYTGNTWDPEAETTYCAKCGAPLIGRDGFRVTSYALDAHGACGACGAALAGEFGFTAEHFGERWSPMAVAF